MNTILVSTVLSRPIGVSTNAGRGRSDVRVRAEEFCRDKIAFPVQQTSTVEGESTLVFLGAGGQSVEVSGKKVCVFVCVNVLRTQHASSLSWKISFRFILRAISMSCLQSSYILDSGLNAGLELPFTCRGGICGACVGRVTEGEVDQSDVRG